MLCAASELHLSNESDGILELPHEMKNGDDLAHLLWDPVFELSLTPNLGHCMSALGIARELSAALQIPLHQTKVTIKEGHLDQKVVVLDPHLCSRYMCRLIEGVHVGPSPYWLKKVLEACGQKSINNVVDTANFVMFKLGQPLHAFDADLLEGKTIEVGPAKQAQKFACLDGVEREVPAGTLMIFDEKKPIAIAGIMGGANSAVSEKTTRILLEAACFDPISIRNASKKIGLRSESSQRFEKGIDPEGLEAALNEATQLIGGHAKGSVDVKKGSFTPKVIAYRPERINRLLGTELSATEIEEIFKRLQFKTKNNHVEVPLYRTDISEEIDLVEEVARIYGYNNIEKTIPACTTSQIPSDPMFIFENEMRRRLAAQGLFEFLTCDLISPKLAEFSREITPPSMGFLQTTYSKSEEYSVLRTSLLPGLLQVTKGNIDQKNLSISAFEIGRIHFAQNGGVTEIPMGAILLTGKAGISNWSHKTVDVDYFDLKGIVENLLTGTFIPSQHLAFHPGRQADIQMGDLIVGSLGEVHPNLLEKFGITQRVYYAELNLESLLKLKKTQVRVAPLPQFPSSERDWTIPLDLKMPIDQLFQAIHSLPSNLLERVELIDLYHPNLAPKKNATFRFTYRDRLKTISFEEVESEHTKVMEQIAKLLGSAPI
jgi:phenylalanyl-tRNA synthetase beta chain